MRNYSYSEHIEDEYFLDIEELYLSKRIDALDNQTNFDIIKHKIVTDIASKILGHGPTDLYENNIRINEARIFLDILEHINETLNSEVSQ